MQTDLMDGAPLASEGCDSCPVAKALRYRVDWLERALEVAESYIRGEEFTAPVEWGLTLQEEIVARLFAAHGGVTHGDILDALDREYECKPRESNIAAVLVSKLRTKLGVFGFQIPRGITGAGVRLPRETHYALRQSMTDGDPVAAPLSSPGRVALVKARIAAAFSDRVAE